MNRRGFIFSNIVASGLLGTNSFAQSGPWPNRPIKIIVPFPPGTANDIAARVLAQNFAPQLNQPVLVENHTGAGGTIGVTTASQMKNGHTLLLASTAMTIAPHFSDVKYDVSRDFDAIGMISIFPGLLVVPANSKYTSLNEVLADARARPGQVICGTGGPGSSSHLAAELFMGLANISLLLVPYKGEGALVPDLLSGTVSIGVVNLPSILRFVRSGQLRALAVAASQPHSDLPGIRTFESLGIPKMEVLGWVVLLAAKGIPSEDLANLERMLAKALSTPEIAKTLVTAGINPVEGGRAKTEDFIKSQGQHWGQLIRSRNIKAE